MDAKADFDLENFLPYLLSQAAETSSLSFQKLYKERYGMVRGEWRVLFHLGLYGEMTAGQIVRKSKTHKTKISRAVKRLGDKGFVRRNQHPQDRRAEQIALTPEGQRAYQDLKSVAAQYDTQLAGRLSAEERDTLRVALRKLAEA
jgi:DNA-binding MarR family transcriptional regulator